MDERIITILKEVAQEHTEDYDGMWLACVFCNGDADYSNPRVDDIIHAANCPTMLARAILREMGTPLHVYQITYSKYSVLSPHSPTHTSSDNFRTGFTEDDVRKLYQDKDLHDVQITYVKDL